MDFSKVKKQVGDTWANGDKQDVPIAYVSKLQKMEDKKVHAIFAVLKGAFESLKNKKKDIKKHADQLIQTYFTENNLNQEQSSFTFYNFDKSLMLEIDSSKPMEYDINLIEQASKHFKTYLDLSTENIEPAFKGLIEDMILNVQKDRMNAGTVKKLEKAGRRINHPEIKNALEVIDRAQGRGLTKIYYRIRVRTDEGKYELLDVNFSAINIE